jgi:hypothetical protein
MLCVSLVMDGKREVFRSISMITPTVLPQATTNQRPTLAARQRLMRANGAFLALVGGAQMIFELLSHYAGSGPLGRIFAGSHYTIGWVEAHGLAMLIGLLLIGLAAPDPKRAWHGFAAGVHLLLGGANMLFWPSFVFWGVVPMGVVATLFHGLFLVVQLYYLAFPAGWIDQC